MRSSMHVDQGRWQVVQALVELDGILPTKYLGLRPLPLLIFLFFVSGLYKARAKVWATVRCFAEMEQGKHQTALCAQTTTLGYNSRI